MGCSRERSSLPATRSYSFTPTLSGGDSASGPSAFTMGGTIVPEPNAVPDPQINYPQGFVGTIDEVAAWTRTLTQPQVQEAMTAPVSEDNEPARPAWWPTSSSTSRPSGTGAWNNDAPGGEGMAQGPTSGTMLAPVATTIPTDPFPRAQAAARVPRLGHRHDDAAFRSVEDRRGSTRPSLTRSAWPRGISSQISVPDADSGTLTVHVESDLGTKTSASLTGGDTNYFVAARTGTYKLTLTLGAPGIPRTRRSTSRRSPARSTT